MLDAYWLLPFKQDENEFFSLLLCATNRSMLAVIPGHLFVLVCLKA